MSRSRTIRDRRTVYKGTIDYSSAEYRACIRKISYVSERAAWKSISGLLERGEVNHCMGVYKCTFCKEWHITSRGNKK